MMSRLYPHEEAFARVQASAPELLEALDELYQWVRNWSPDFTYDDEWPATRDKVAAAIAKARGTA